MSQIANETIAIANETIAIDPPSLRITEGPGKGRKIRIPLGGLVIGREAETPQLHADTALSRRHARLEIARDGSVEVTDLGSVNGTFCNGQRLTQPAHLKDSDVLRLGNTELTVSVTAQGPATAPGRPEATSAPARLAEGKRLFEQGRLAESKQAFSKALADPGSAAAAHYGLGVIALAANDLGRAERSFLAAIEIDSSHSNAAFQLGLLAERRHEIGQARTWYHRALAAAPEHVSALARLDATAPAPSAPSPLPAAAKAHDPGTPPGEMQPDLSRGPGGPEIIYYLRQDNLPISRQTIQLMKILEMDVRPRFSAYVGRYSGRIAVGIILVLAGLIALARITKVDDLGRTTRVDVHAVTLIVIALAIGITAVAYINVACMRIRIANGRLQIERGVLHKKVKNIDLWHVVNVGLDRTLVNRITGDGTLELALNLDPIVDPRKKPKGTHTTVRITGLVSGPDLSEMQQDLLNIAFLLRGNPVLKGIIQ
jgi:tetratricopeptide (TPR) repeat protein